MQEIKINGSTAIIPHVGVPTYSFRSPMIYNPWFAAKGINCVVVPMGCEVENFPRLLPELFALRNTVGALITMPHKQSVVGLLAEVTEAVKICGACNAVKKDSAGRLVGDMFDGEGFTRGVKNKGRQISGTSALVVGSGGVGSAIAASLAKEGVARLCLRDANPKAAEALAARLVASYPNLTVETGTQSTAGQDILVNASPLGMKDGDPLPMDLSHANPAAFVGEVVLSKEITPLLAEARRRGMQTQVGTDMLFEQIPAYLEYFGFPQATAQELRDYSKIEY
jgi:shikimate dehydrogenase